MTRTFWSRALPHYTGIINGEYFINILETMMY